VVVGELLDSLEEGFVPEGCDGDACGKQLRMSLITEHPLQPFSPAYFDSEDPGCFSYSGEHLAGAQALTGPRREAPVLLSAALPFREENPIEVRLADLIRFFRMPSECLLSRRLGIQLGERVDELEEREPIALDALTRFHAGEYLLKQKLRGIASEDIYPILKNTGNFPLGVPGRIAFDELDESAGLLADGIRSVYDEEEILPPISGVVILDGVRVSGTIDGLTSGGRRVYTFGRLTEGRKIDFWLTHLFLNALSTPCPNSSLLIGLEKKEVDRCEFPSLSNAEGLLRDLLEVYRLGLTVPLPLFPVASSAYARAFIDSGGNAPDYRTMARITAGFLRENPEYPGESMHPAIRRLFGTRNPLLDEGELGFAALSVRVFAPMLRAGMSDGQTAGKDGNL